MNKMHSTREFGPWSTVEFTEKMRSVKVFGNTCTIVNGKRLSVREEIGEGVFHGWGVDYREFESGPCQFPVAIVEMDDGRVILPMADNIQFIVDWGADNE